MAREMASKKTTFLSVNRDGRFCSTVSEPKEGYEEYTSSTGKVYYRKYFYGTDIGHISNISIVERIFGENRKEKLVNIVVEGDDFADIVQIPLLTQKGSLNDIIKRVIAVLPGVDFSREITLSASGKKNDRGYTDRVIFFNYANNGEIEKEALKFTLKFGKDGDIPPVEKENGISGIEYNSKKQDNYLFNILTEQIERFKEYKNSTHPAPEESETPTVTTENNLNEHTSPKLEDGEDDDLPF